MTVDQQLDFKSEQKNNIFWTEESEKPKEGTIIDNYLIEKEVIETRCSFLMKAKDVRNDADKAVKFIKYKYLHTERYINEVEIMKMIDHPNILKLEFSTVRFPYVIIATKFAPYKNLAEFIRDNYPKGMPENIARNVMFQMLDSVNYLHKHKIRHRDIKPHNYLVFENEPCIKIVLADFGFAKQFNYDEQGTEYIGTELFAPPEIHLHQPYGNSVDIWPLGISLFFILTCRSAYRSCSDHNARTEKIIKGMLNYRLLRVRKISNEAIDMIKKMCKVDPSKRLTAEELLNHPWMKNEKINQTTENNIIIR